MEMGAVGFHGSKHFPHPFATVKLINNFFCKDMDMGAVGFHGNKPYV